MGPGDKDGGGPPSTRRLRFRLEGEGLIGPESGAADEEEEEEKEEDDDEERPMGRV